MLDINTIESVVNSILTTKKTIRTFQTGSKVAFTGKSDIFVDKKREFQGLLTEFVVNEFFPSAKESEPFLNLNILSIYNFT